MEFRFYSDERKAATSNVANASRSRDMDQREVKSTGLLLVAAVEKLCHTGIALANPGTQNGATDTKTDTNHSEQPDNKPRAVA
jgi:hypothetical protein